MTCGLFREVDNCLPNLSGGVNRMFEYASQSLNSAATLEALYRTAVAPTARERKWALTEILAFLPSRPLDGL